MLKTLEEHLVILGREGHAIWHPGLLTGGLDIKAEMQREIAVADIIIFLISPSLLASEELFQMLGEGVKRSRDIDGAVHLVPVLLRPTITSSAWQGIQALPSNGQSVTEWRDQDAAWADIALGIRTVIRDILQRTSATSSCDPIADQAGSLRQVNHGFDRPALRHRTLVWVGGIALLLCAAATNFTSRSTPWDGIFWELLLVGWISCLVALWPRRLPAPQARRQYGVILAATSLALAAGGWRYYDTHYRRVDAPDLDPGPIPPPAHGSIWRLLEGVAHANPNAPPSSIAISFSLDEKKTTVVQTRITGSNGNEQSLYEAPLQVLRSLRTKGCLPSFEPAAERSRTALKRFAIAARPDAGLAKFLDEGSFMTLTLRRQDVVGKLLPRGEEWRTLPRSDYEAILEWVVQCIGIRHPVFLVTVTNRSRQDALLSRIDYTVLDTLHGRSTDPGGPVSPNVTYTHVIPFRRGSFPQPLNPPFRVAAGATATFVLQLRPDLAQAGLSYTMKPVFVTDQGSISLEPFRVVLNGKSE